MIINQFIFYLGYIYSSFEKFKSNLKKKLNQKNA